VFAVPEDLVGHRTTVGDEARKKRSVKLKLQEGFNFPVFQLGLLKGEKLTESLN